MVKVRGCESCRQSRVKCDNQRPICGRCARLRRECTGYRDTTDLVIVQDETQPARLNTTQENAPRSVSEHRDTVSRSRYIPPQQYSHCQKLPWLRKDLANEPRPRLHDIAVSRFFAHYVIYPNRHVGDDGYLPDLPYFYSRSSDGSALQSAVRACALASYANALRQNELFVRARRAYGEALKALQGGVLDGAVMKRDDTLMCILVLDFFTVLTDETPVFLGPHSSAISSILYARGNQQIRTTVGWNLFRIAHRRLQHRKMFNFSMQEQIDTLSWFADTAPTHIEARLGYNGCRIISACQKAREIIAEDVSSSALLEEIEELHRIAVETSAWNDLLPESWLPWTCTSAQSAVFDDIATPNSANYSDIWIANTWNCHRTYQVHLHETLFECYNHLSHFDEDDGAASTQTDIQDAVRGIVDDMLNSIPFLVGAHPVGDRQYQQPELGSYYAFGATDCVGRSTLARGDQKDRASWLGAKIFERWKHTSVPS